ncbi:MAG: TAXI family TRAP transporter solute-binding subunit [Nitrospinota bacterium]
MARLVRTLALLVALTFVLGLAGPAEAQKVKLYLGTSQPGGATFEVGTAIGKVITDNSGGRLEVAASLTGGSTANVRALQKKDSKAPFRMGMTTSPAAFWGQNAKPPFKKKQDVLVLTALFPLTVLYAARKATGITKWADLVGKKFVVGGRGGSIYKITENALRYSGMYDKVQKEYFTNPQNTAAIKDGRVDAGFFFAGGFKPVPAYMDLARTRKGQLNFFGPDEATIKKMEERDPGVVRVVWPANSAPGQPYDVVTWGQMWTIIVNSKMSNENAHLVVKTLMENHKQIQRYHPLGKLIGPKTALKGTKRLTFHPGAIRYWKEKGRM